VGQSALGVSEAAGHEVGDPGVVRQLQVAREHLVVVLVVAEQVNGRQHRQRSVVVPEQALQAAQAKEREVAQVERQAARGGDLTYR